MNFALAGNQLKLGTRLLKHYHLRNDMSYCDPFKAKYFITRKCNLSCKHCGIGGNSEQREELTTLEVERLIKNNPCLQVFSISGGEPFLRDDLLEITKAVFRLMPDLMLFSINTNGWLTEKIVKLAQNTVDDIPAGCNFYIAVSSDGPESIHNEIRCNSDSFRRKEETIAALRKIAAKKPQFKVRHNINVNPWNMNSVLDYIEDCEKMGDDVIVSLYSASKHYSHSDEHFERFAEFKKRLLENDQLLKRLRQRGTFLSNRFLVQAGDFYASSKRVQPLPCFSLKASLIVESWGDVRPCINYPVNLGNVKDSDFDLVKIISESGAERIRETIRKQHCPVCWTPSEAYVSLMCNMPNPKFWRKPDEAVKTILLRQI